MANHASVVTTTCPADHVALVTIDRPEARNAIDGAVTQELARAVLETEADDSIRVVILTGAGTAFCAGADLKAVQQGRNDELFTSEGGFAGFVDVNRRKPWIAAVNGPALAGGCELVLACDMVVASEKASFGLSEVKRGLVAVGGGIARLSRWLPRAVAIELALTGRPIGAIQAAAHGMVNRVTAPDALIASAIDLAQEISANAPIAVRESLAVIRQAGDLTHIELMALSAKAREAVGASEDFSEGIAAFIGKRAPRWTGR